MAENEAIEILTEGKSWLSNDRIIDAFCMGIEALEEIGQYRTIGTLEECSEAVEKQKATRPYYEVNGYAPNGGVLVYHRWICPNCDSKYEVGYDYCPNCGQKIDWSKE